jgi:hypothetical protein
LKVERENIVDDVGSQNGSPTKHRLDQMVEPARPIKRENKIADNTEGKRQVDSPEALPKCFGEVGDFDVVIDVVEDIPEKSGEIAGDPGHIQVKEVVEYIEEDEHGKGTR